MKISKQMNFPTASWINGRRIALKNLNKRYARV